VLEAFWPELDPRSAANSLNQTLYFLRRDIDPGFVEDVSVPYVRFDGDLLWLDAELVHSDSLRFHQSVSRVAKSPGSSVDELLGVFELYAGRFAPEFEYDDWSASWRELLHAEYLQTAETLMSRLVAARRTGEAVAVATGTLATDPEADRIELQLIRLYSASGSDAAAAEQYGHYASTQRGEYGVEPPSLDEILRSPEP
jgi:DNA-binding SARP family transcriptional activator